MTSRKRTASSSGSPSGSAQISTPIVTPPSIDMNPTQPTPLASSSSSSSSSSTARKGGSVRGSTKRQAYETASPAIQHTHNVDPIPASIKSQDEEVSKGLSSTTASNTDDLLRGIYLAPIALLVLDCNRCIRMLNGPGEVILEVDNTTCTGKSFDQYLHISSRQSLSSVLDEASDRYSRSTSQLSAPLHCRVKTKASEGQDSGWVDLSISAWYQPETTYDSANEPTRHIPSSQDAYFTISMSSSSTTEEKGPKQNGGSVRGSLPIKREEGQESNVVKEFVVQHMDLAFLALNKERQIVGRNRASDKIFSALRDVEASCGITQDEEDEFDLHWIRDRALLMDENFEVVLSSFDWPSYKSAVLGEKVSPMIIGLQSKVNGSRLVVEIAGHPVRDRGGQGEHIGGVLTFRNVTAEREKLKAQAEVEGDVFFKQTCNAMPQMVFVTSNTGGDEWYSDAWYEYTGAPRHVSDTQGILAYAHTDDIDHAMTRWGQALQTGGLFDSVLRFKRPDGIYRWFQSRALPVRDSNGNIIKWFGTCTDVNDHLEALASSRRAQNQLESVINHANVTLWAVDREGIITIAKGPGIRQLRLTTASSSGSEKESIDSHGHSSGDQRPESVNHSHTNRDMIGKSIYDVWELENIHQALKQALEGQVIVEEMEIDGRWFRTSYTPMRAQVDEMYNLGVGLPQFEGKSEGEEDSKIIGVVGASLDITDRKKAQAQMEKSLLEKTNALAAEGAAREASRLKSEFLANMSHEIRTPIAGVIGLAELILDEKSLTLPLRDYAETIQRSAEGLLVVINDVLDFSKVEIGKMEVEQAPFHLNVLIMDAKRLLTFATHKKGLDFQESLNLTYKGLLIGDVGRLKQVITNLLTNAIKFTSRGYIRLEVSEVSQDAEKLNVRFDVRDTGCGISARALAKLFKPFSQADSSTARRFGGTGLGLSISKNLVELMDGEIGLSSVEGQGSQAWFCIPFLKAKAVKDADGSDTLENGTDVGGRSVLHRNSSLPPSPIIRMESFNRSRENIWILIAEDNKVNARIASKNVEKMGFKCRIADNGFLVLQELNNRKYDLVLMDCQMPDCDGYEATGMIRKSANSAIRTLPVIALTASAIIGDRERALDAGMVDYLVKPVKRAALETTLCKWLFDSQARQSLTKYMDDYVPPFESDVILKPMSSITKAASVIKWNEEVHVEGNGKTYALNRDTHGLLGDDVDGFSSHYNKAQEELYDTASPSNSQSFATFKRKGSADLHLYESDRQSQPINRRSGDNLGDAASLLTSRRFSSEDTWTQSSTGEVKFSRPLLSSRSKSHAGVVGVPTSSGSGLAISPTPE